MHGPPNNSFKFDPEVRLTYLSEFCELYISLTFCKYSLNKVLPRVFVQCKPTPGVSYMYTHADNQLLLLPCCNMLVNCMYGIYPISRIYIRIPTKRDIRPTISLREGQCLSVASKMLRAKPKGTSEALQKHPPFPLTISLHIPLVGMYLIYTRFRLFWPEIFRSSSLSASIHSAITLCS